MNDVRRERGLSVIQDKDEIYGQNVALVNSAFGMDYARRGSPLFKMETGFIFLVRVMN